MIMDPAWEAFCRYIVPGGRSMTNPQPRSRVPGLVEAEEVKRLFNLEVGVLSRSWWNQEKLEIVKIHPWSESLYVTKWIAGVRRASRKVCTRDVQGGESGDDDCQEYDGGQDHHDDDIDDDDCQEYGGSQDCLHDIDEVDKDINDMELPEFPQGDVQGGESEYCGDDVDGDGDGDDDIGVDSNDSGDDGDEYR